MVVVVYSKDFVDDFLVCGPVKSDIQEVIQQYREKATTTEPIWDPEHVLGNQIIWDRGVKRIILTMENKINQLVKEYGEDRLMKRKYPMSKQMWLVNDDELDKIGEDGRRLDDKERRDYQALVGSLVWISGLRADINYSVNYLSSFGKDPRIHHVKVAESVLGYLWNTSHYGLELGGGKISINAYSDSSYGTGRNGRSINGSIVKLSNSSGAVIAKTTKSKYVRLSSYEAEMEALNTTIRLVVWIKQIVKALIEFDDIPEIKCDNLALVNFVKGNGEVNGVKHMELKMYYCREGYVKGIFKIEHLPGVNMPADAWTKVCDRRIFERFRMDVLGCSFIDETTIESTESPKHNEQINKLVNVGGCVGGSWG